MSGKKSLFICETVWRKPDIYSDGATVGFGFWGRRLDININELLHRLSEVITNSSSLTNWSFVPLSLSVLTFPLRGSVKPGQLTALARKIKTGRRREAGRRRSPPNGQTGSSGSTRLQIHDRQTGRHFKTISVILSMYSSAGEAVYTSVCGQRR